MKMTHWRFLAFALAVGLVLPIIGCQSGADGGATAPEPSTGSVTGKVASVQGPLPFYEVTVADVAIALNPSVPGASVSWSTAGGEPSYAITNVPTGTYTVTASKLNYSSATSTSFSVHGGRTVEAFPVHIDLLRSIVTVKADAGAFSDAQSGITVLIDGVARGVLTPASPNTPLTLPVGTHTFAAYAAATGHTHTWSTKSYYVNVETMTYTFTGQ